MQHGGTMAYRAFPILILLSGILHVPFSAAGACPAGTTALAVDSAKSAIRWKGTKFWGLGSHEGTVRIKSGELCVRDGRVETGIVLADMTSIQVTDIPADDPIPRNRLRDHLLSENFFHASAHPEARIEITGVALENRSLHKATANLTIRNQTHPVTFYARVWIQTASSVRAEARFPVDRQKFGVSYVGSTIRDDLVDDQFWLDVSIEASARSGK